MSMLCRILRDTGVAEMFEYSSLRLHIISFHLYIYIYIHLYIHLYIYIFCENCRSRLYIECQK